MAPNLTKLLFKLPNIIFGIYRLDCGTLRTVKFCTLSSQIVDTSPPNYPLFILLFQYLLSLEMVLMSTFTVLLPKGVIFHFVFTTLDFRHD